MSMDSSCKKQRARGQLRVDIPESVTELLNELEKVLSGVALLKASLNSAISLMFRMSLAAVQQAGDFHADPGSHRLLWRASQCPNLCSGLQLLTQRSPGLTLFVGVASR